MSNWTVYKYDPACPTPPITLWGKDHWSTFAYLETCAVDRNGIIDNRRMRCNANLHKDLAHHDAITRCVYDGSEYPTRLKDKKFALLHDDWSCLEDMIELGLVKALHDGNCSVKVQLTTLGFEVAAQLRQHKAKGGKYVDFIPETKGHKNG